MAACMIGLRLITIYLLKLLVPVLSQLPNLAWDGQQKVGMKACETIDSVIGGGGGEREKAAEHIQFCQALNVSTFFFFVF